MTDFAGNYKNNIKYKRTNGMCWCMEENESESHLLNGNCRVYGDLRKNMKLTDDKSVMLFFQEVLNRREELEEQGMTNTCPRPGGEANNMIELVAPGQFRAGPKGR